MIISYICGGLGNQMFQYAAGFRLARRHQTELKLNLEEYKNGSDSRPAGLEQFSRPIKLFDLQVSGSAACTAEINRLRDVHVASSTTDRIVRQIRKLGMKNFRIPVSHVAEKSYLFDPSILNLPDNVYLKGYWQSWKYFDDVVDELRAEFRFKDPAIMTFSQQFIQQLRRPGVPLVSLHVRRGDLAHAAESLGNAALVHGNPIDLQYIHTAMDRFDENVDFLVCSDTAKDVEWCRQNIRREKLNPARLHFSEGHTDLQDLALMSSCDHHIIANSTFSWWAAWLNPTPNRRVIAPRRWSPSGGKMVPNDLVPTDWEMI